MLNVRQMPSASASASEMGSKAPDSNRMRPAKRPGVGQGPSARLIGTGSESFMGSFEGWVMVGNMGTLSKRSIRRRTRLRPHKYTVYDPRLNCASLLTTRSRACSLRQIIRIVSSPAIVPMMSVAGSRSSAWATVCPPPGTVLSTTR